MMFIKLVPNRNGKKKETEMSVKKTNNTSLNNYYQFRIILIGDSTVGKSSILRQFTDGAFIQSADPTVGVDFHVRIIELKGLIFLILFFRI